MKKLNRIKRAFLVGMVIFSFVFAGCSRNEIKIGTGGEGGNYYSYGISLSEKVTDATDYSMSVKETAGSAANIRLISEGYLDLALVQSDILASAYNREGVFAESDNLSGFHTVTGLYTENIQVVVKADSGIKTISDLKGKTIAVGEKDSGSAINAEEILKAAKIKNNDITKVYGSYNDGAKALENGEVDALFVTASYPTTAITELSEQCEIAFVNIENRVAEKLLEKYNEQYDATGNGETEENGLDKNNGYKETVIPAGTYKGQAEDIHTVGVTAVLIANDSLDKDLEDKIVEILKESNKELQEVSFGVQVQQKEDKRPVIALDMYMTLAIAVLVLYVGAFLKKKIRFFETFCIPAPVIGGVLFALISCGLYVGGVVEFTFDETFKNICMIMFFTSVGFQANLKVLKSGGKSLVVFLIAVILLIVSQNALSVGIAKALGISPLIGLCTGSIPMVGGHGTAGAFGIVLEDMGLAGATTLCTAAATFGLIAGSVMGGPIGRRLILKHKLMQTVTNIEEELEADQVLVEDEKNHKRHVNMYAPAAYQIAIAMGIGTIVSMLLSKTGMTFPVYIGAMIVAAFMRNIGEYSKKFTVHMGEINSIGGICLSLFLGIAMVTLKLWQLASLALPLVLLLVGQTLFMMAFSYFVVYNLMGRNYDAAVLSAGTCGFGMGATPNAMANMQALTEKFAPSVKAYLLVPIVGSMFADFINSLVITFFINLL